MSDRKKPAAAIWATVVLVVGLLYVASFGPACWYCQRTDRLVVASRAYFPLGWIVAHAASPIGAILRGYARAGLPEKVHVALPTSLRKWDGVVML